MQKIGIEIAIVDGQNPTLSRQVALITAKLPGVVNH
jgi:hypothetical protein